MHDMADLHMYEASVEEDVCKLPCQSRLLKPGHRYAAKQTTGSYRLCNILMLFLQ